MALLETGLQIARSGTKFNLDLIVLNTVTTLQLINEVMTLIKSYLLFLEILQFSSFERNSGNIVDYMC